MTSSDRDVGADGEGGDLHLGDVESFVNDSLVVQRLSDFLRAQRYFSDPHLDEDLRFEVGWWHGSADDLAVELIVHNGELGLWYVPVILRSVEVDPTSTVRHDVQVIDLLQDQRERDALLKVRMPGLSLRGGTRLIDREQSNSAVTVGSDIFVKLYRRLRQGTHREVDTLVRLSDGADAPVPKVHDVGVVGGVTVMVAVDYLPNAHDLYADCTGGSFDDSELQVVARRIGSTLADLHRSLRKVTETRVESYAQIRLSARERMVRSVERCLEHHHDQLGPDERSRLHDLIGRFSSTDHPLWAKGPRADVGIRTQLIHGDLHLGQILLEGSASEGTIAYIDFEGEVLATSQMGSALDPVERDLGGLQRSFAYVEAMRRINVSTSTLAPGLLFEICLEAYRSELDSASISDELVHVFAAEKAAYELEYELLAGRGLVSVPLSYLAEI